MKIRCRGKGKRKKRWFLLQGQGEHATLWVEVAERHWKQGEKTGARNEVAIAMGSGMLSKCSLNTYFEWGQLCDCQPGVESDGE